METTEIVIDIQLHKHMEQNRREFSETPNAILKRLLGLTTDSKTEATPPHARDLGSRKTGDFNFEINGKSHSEKSLKSAYKAILLILSEANTTFLDSLSTVEYSARRIVAKEPKDLYKKSPHLAEKFAEELSGGYWLDTNLSTQQVMSRLQDSCSVAKIHLGSDLIVDFPD